MSADEPTEHPSLEELFGREPEPAPADVASPQRAEPDPLAGDPPTIDDLFATIEHEEAVAAADEPDDDEADHHVSADEPPEPDDDQSNGDQSDDVSDDAAPELDDEAQPDGDEPDHDPGDVSARDDAGDDEDLIALADEAVTRFADESAAADERERTDAAAAAAAEAERRARAAPTIAETAAVVDPADPSGAAADPGGLVLQFPSRDFPPPPVFRIRVPNGWLAVPVPEAEMAVRHPQTFDGFHPNVLVRVRRAAASPTIRDDLRRVAGLEDAPEGMEVLSDDVQTEITTPARWLLVRFPGPGGVVLRARHLLVYVTATEHVANIVSVAGTWPEAAGDDIAAQVDGVVGSLRLLMPQTRS